MKTNIYNKVAAVINSSPKLGEVPQAEGSVKTHNLTEHIAQRKELRTNGTAAEATMWKMLKARQVMGKKFRRQFGIESYVLDFYCPEAHLAVELDGQPHYTIEGDLHDTDRDEHLLATHGIRTLRFENCDVFRNPEGVLAEIKEALQNSSPKLGEVPVGGRGLSATDLTDPSGLKATSPNLGEELNTPNAEVTNFPPNLGEQLKCTIRKASLLSALCTLLLISSCTNDEITAPTVATDDVLAALPADTRVGVKAEITDNREQRTTTRAEGDETVYYAVDEIHPNKEVRLGMEVPGASDASKRLLCPTEFIPLNTLTTTEPFSTLRLKDFNLTEGDGRCVSRWTVLNATYGGKDNLWGWARLTADATTGQPVLDYGAMKQGNAKVTIVVQDENGNAVNVSGSKVSASLSLPFTYSDVIYTPEGETVGTDFIYYLNAITTLAADEAIKPEGIGLATYAYGSTGNSDYILFGMLTADGNRYYGEHNNTLAAIVPATVTHTTDFRTFTPIPGGPQFTGSEVLIIEVTEDPDGADGPMTTGKYSLALSQVKLAEGENLTALKPGEHYILTVTLRHNTLVSATATIGAWSEAAADVTLGGDDAKLPPSYTYDADTDTYIVFGEAILAEGQKVLTWDETAKAYIPAADAADVTAGTNATWCDKTWKEIKLTETSNE